MWQNTYKYFGVEVEEEEKYKSRLVRCGQQTTIDQHKKIKKLMNKEEKFKKK
jgi:hypothetical protein